MVSLINIMIMILLFCENDTKDIHVTYAHPLVHNFVCLHIIRKLTCVFSILFLAYVSGM